MFGAQATGCNPISNTVKTDALKVRPVRNPNTIAKSLAIGDPADGYFASRLIRETGGWGEDVDDEAIVGGMRLLAETEGIFAETAGGVTIATLAKLAAAGVIRRDERVVAYVTGHGLKTIEAVAPRSVPTATIAPTLDAFNAALGPDLEESTP